MLENKYKRIHTLQNRSTASKNEPLTWVTVTLSVNSSVYICKCAITKPNRHLEKVLPLRKSRVPMADPWTWYLPTARFRPDMYRRATGHRNALSKGMPLSKSQGGLDQMHPDLLSTRYHLCCNRDHKLQLSIRNRRTEAVIIRGFGFVRIWL